MSKLSERIKRASKVEPAPLGFAPAARKAPASTMFVAVRLAANEIGKIGEAADKGAAVVILDGGAAKLREATTTGDAIIGIKLDKPDRKEAAAAREAGADFLLIDDGTLAETLLDDKLGFVMSAATDLDDTRVRLLGELSLEALLVAAPKPPLTVTSVLDLRRLAGMAHAPLLVEVDAGIDASTLQVLRESGAAGVVVSASDISKIAGLNELIAGLPVRGKRKDDKTEALVPASAQSGGHDDDDDEDDYDD
jgi:hypothetical protein